ncbi:MAG: peptide chain release factor-like protein [Chloroflexi bacterium]|nr:peptide chain release factor-like protein [Chloroflexota bacterium]
MTENQTPSRDYKKITPDDFDNYEEQYVEKGGGGGSGTKNAGRKGKKTIKALRKQQRDQSREGRRTEVKASLKRVLKNFPTFENPEIQEKHLNRYRTWIEDNLRGLTPLDSSDLVISFSKSGGPGGQNVNKRETKVLLVHQPTFIQVESDQTRSQLQNKNLALEILQERLKDHLNDWKEYLEPDQIVEIELIKNLLV